MILITRLRRWWWSQTVRVGPLVVSGMLSLALLVLLCQLPRLSGAPDPIAVKSQGPDTIGNPMPSIAMPAGATGTGQTQITSSTTGANAQIVATLAGAVGKTTYLTGVVISGNGATASSGVTVTITGTISGTLNIIYVTGTLNTAGDGLETITFPTPIAASATNTAIVVTVPAMGAGNTLAAVVATGFQQ